jgi:hypothetical protein
MMTSLSRLGNLLRRGPRPNAEILGALQTQGFHIVPEFLDGRACATIVEQLDDMFAKYSEKIQHERAEGTAGDYRIFGAESRLPMLNEAMAAHPWLRDIATAYMNSDMATHFTMANKLEFVEGQVSNSGAGWHRDSSAKQFKAIMYLTDVGPENGPFTIVPSSREASVPARDNARNENRFDDAAVADLVEQIKRSPVEVVGAAGTCILVDTSHLHRGKDIQRGCRYAVTNYYYRNTLERRRKTQAKWGRYLLDPIA